MVAVHDVPDDGVRPVYRAGSRTYQVDDCAAQLAAIRDGHVRFRGYSRGHYPGEPIDTETLPGVSSIGVLDTIGWQEWGAHAHRNEGVEFCFLETGSGVFHLARKHYALEAGALTITRPWQLHRVGDPTISHSRLYWVIIDVGVRRPRQSWSWPSWVVLSRENRDELTRRLKANAAPVVPGSSDIKQCFRALGKTMATPSSTRFSRMAVHINHLMLGILDLLRKESRTDDLLVQRRRTVTAFLQRLSDDPARLAEPWTLDSMAEACGMRSSAFVTYCRKVTNQSPMDHLIEARIRHAAALLVNDPGRSITDIALDCGFSSSQYFATVFRRHLHRTPSAYRTWGRDSPA